MWKHLPGTREPSVHMAEFPARAQVEEMLDPDLVRRWERLIAIRDEVNRALEVARQEKTIGNSLGARVTVKARGAAADLLQSVRDDLAMLFIVSQLNFETTSGDGPDVEVSVTRAEGEKCARCWRIVPTTSAGPETAGLCDRCVAATAGQHAA
jgi:isoleucyl-tRNA synthetase